MCVGTLAANNHHTVTRLHNGQSSTLASLLYRGSEPYAGIRHASTTSTHSAEASLSWDPHATQIRPRLLTETFNLTHSRRSRIDYRLRPRDYGNMLATTYRLSGCSPFRLHDSGYSLSSDSLGVTSCLCRLSMHGVTSLAAPALCNSRSPYVSQRSMSVCVCVFCYESR